MRIVTFNLRCPWDGDGVNSFIHRAGMIYGKIRAERPDVIAFQEVTPKNFDFLYHSLSDIYDVQVRYRSENYDGEGVLAEIEADPSPAYADVLIYLLPAEEDVALKTALSMAGSK